MAWCEANGVQYVLGLAGNTRLVRKLGPEMRKAKRRAKRTNQPARVFADFDYRTRKSWCTKRRVIGKAEWTQGGANPRFIVTNVHAANGDARFLYEDVPRIGSSGLGAEAGLLARKTLWTKAI